MGELGGGGVVERAEKQQLLNFLVGCQGGVRSWPGKFLVYFFLVFMAPERGAILDFNHYFLRCRVMMGGIPLIVQD